MTKNQRLLSEMALGVLVYSVVLGFFNDYTNILYTKSYSITFTLAVVLQGLTYATFGCKKWLVKWLKQGDKAPSKLTMGFSIWLIMFSSKFVFLAVIEALFGEQVHFSGFIGLLIVIAFMTLATAGITYLYKRLGEDVKK